MAFLRGAVVLAEGISILAEARKRVHVFDDRTRTNADKRGR
jgi:hypothetical protein